jgi:hypothetical protein
MHSQYLATFKALAATFQVSGIKECPIKQHLSRRRSGEIKNYISTSDKQRMTGVGREKSIYYIFGERKAISEKMLEQTPEKMVEPVMELSGEKMGKRHS